MAACWKEIYVETNLEQIKRVSEGKVLTVHWYHAYSSPLGPEMKKS